MSTTPSEASEASGSSGTPGSLDSPGSSAPSEDRATPDALLHARNGTEVTPEDLVLATGRDLTPENLEWARRRIEADGVAALDRLLP